MPGTFTPRKREATVEDLLGPEPTIVDYIGHEQGWIADKARRVAKGAIEGTGDVISGLGTFPQAVNRMVDVGQEKLAATLGLNPTQLAALRANQQNVQEMEAPYRAAQQAGTALRQIGDLIEPDPTREQDFSSKVAQGAGSLPPVLGAALISPGAAAFSAGAMQGESARREAEQAGATDREQAATFLLNAGVTAGSEPLLGAPAMLKGILNSDTVQPLVRVGLEAVKSAAREGFQEGLEQIGQNIIARDVVGYKPDQDRWEGVGENALVGAVVGGGVSAAGAGGVEGYRAYKDRGKPKTDAEYSAEAAAAKQPIALPNEAAPAQPEPSAPGSIADMLAAEAKAMEARREKEKAELQRRDEAKAFLRERAGRFDEQMKVADEVAANPQATYAEVKGSLEAARYYAEDNSLGLDTQKVNAARAAVARLENRLEQLQPAEDARREAEAAAVASLEKEARDRRKAEAEALKAVQKTGRDPKTGNLVDLKALPQQELQDLDLSKPENQFLEDGTEVTEDMIAAELERRGKAEERAAAQAPTRDQYSWEEFLAARPLPRNDPVLQGELDALAEEMNPAQRMKYFRSKASDLDAAAEAARADYGFADVQTPADLIDHTKRMLRGEKIVGRGTLPQVQFARGEGGQPLIRWTSDRTELDEIGAPKGTEGAWVLLPNGKGDMAHFLSDNPDASQNDLIDEAANMIAEVEADMEGGRTVEQIRRDIGFKPMAAPNLPPTSPTRADLLESKVVDRLGDVMGTTRENAQSAVRDFIAMDGQRAFDFSAQFPSDFQRQLGDLWIARNPNRPRTDGAPAQPQPQTRTRRPDTPEEHRRAIDEAAKALEEIGGDDFVTSPRDWLTNSLPSLTKNQADAVITENYPAGSEAASLVWRVWDTAPQRSWNQRPPLTVASARLANAMAEMGVDDETITREMHDLANGKRTPEQWASGAQNRLLEPARQYIAAVQADRAERGADPAADAAAALSAASAALSRAFEANNIPDARAAQYFRELAAGTRDPAWFAPVGNTGNSELERLARRYVEAVQARRTAGAVPGIIPERTQTSQSAPPPSRSATTQAAPSNPRLQAARMEAARALTASGWGPTIDAVQSLLDQLAGGQLRVLDLQPNPNTLPPETLRRVLREFVDAAGAAAAPRRNYGSTTIVPAGWSTVAPESTRPAAPQTAAPAPAPEPDRRPLFQRLAKTFRRIAGRDEAWQFGRKPTASKDIHDIAADYSTPKKKVVVNWASDREYYISLKDPQGKLTGTLVVSIEPGNNVYVNAAGANSNREEEGGGKQAYQTIFTWAHNNGLLVHGNSLSPVNQFRRTVNMLSSALRHGTTNHLKPYSSQEIKGWVDGDTENNIGAMVAALSRMAGDRAPILNQLTYDLKTDTVVDANEGRRISPADLLGILKAADLGKKQGIGPGTAKVLLLARAELAAYARGNRLPSAKLLAKAAKGSLGKLFYAREAAGNGGMVRRAGVDASTDRGAAGALSADPALLTEPDLSRESDAFKKAFRRLVEQNEVKIENVRKALRDRGYTGVVPADVEAAIYRLRNERGLIVVSAKAYQNRARGAGLFMHEVAHIYWETLPEKTKEALRELHRQEVESRTGPLYQNGKKQSDVKFVEALDENGHMEWFSERIRALNKEWAKGKLDTAEMPLLRRVAYQLREFIRKVWAQLARADGIDPDSKLFQQDFRRFVESGADAAVGRKAGVEYARSQMDADFAKAKQEQLAIEDTDINPNGKPPEIYAVQHAATLLGKRLNSYLDFAKTTGRDIGKVSEFMRNMRALLTKEFEQANLNEDQVVEVANAVGIESPAASVVLDADIARDPSWQDTTLLFENGKIIGGHNTGEIIARRRFLSDFGKLVGFATHGKSDATYIYHAWNERKTGKEEISPFQVRGTTRNELKFALGKQEVLVNPVKIKFAPEDLEPHKREQYLAFINAKPVPKPRRADKLINDAIKYNKAEWASMETPEAARYIMQKTGLTWEAFWSAANKGDVDLVNRLALEPNKLRENYRKAGRYVGPIPVAGARPAERLPRNFEQQGSLQFARGERPEDPVAHLESKLVDVRPGDRTAIARAKAWEKVMPAFQGGKYQRAEAAAKIIREQFTQAELDQIDTVQDYFGGGGMWGAYLALSHFKNAKRVVVHEFDPLRAAKIELYHTRGNEIRAIMRKPEVQDLIATAVELANSDEATSGTALAARLKIAGEGGNADVRAVAGALKDAALGARGRATDAAGNKTAEATAEKIVGIVIRDAEDAYRGIKELQSRGVTIERRTGDSYAQEPSGGDKTVAVMDPPYYRTTGYDGKQVGIDVYSRTAEMVRRMAAAGNAVVYTDSAWHIDNPKAATADQPGREMLGNIVDSLGAFGIVKPKDADRHELIGINRPAQSERANAIQPINPIGNSSSGGIRPDEGNQPESERGLFDESAETGAVAEGPDGARGQDGARSGSRGSETEGAVITERPRTPQEEQYDRLRDEFDRATDDIERLKAQIKNLEENEGDKNELRARRGELYDAEQASRRIYRKLEAMRADLESQAPTRPMLPEGQTAADVLKRYTSGTPAQLAEREAALIAEWRMHKEIRDKGRKVGNETAEEQGQRGMMRVERILDDEFPNWKKKAYAAPGTPRPKLTPPAAEPEAAGMDDAEASPFAEPDKEMPIRAGKANEIFGQSGIRPSWVERTWDRVVDALRGIKGAVPEIPVFAEAWWNKGDQFIRDQGPHFYDGIRALYRKLTSSNDAIQREAEDKVAAITKPLIEAGGDFSADDYARLQRRQEQVRKLRAAGKAPSQGVIAEINALNAKAEASPYVLFNKAVMLLDLKWRGENLKDSAGNPIKLPMGINLDEVNSELVRIDQLITANEHAGLINQAIAAHRKLVADVAAELRNRGLIEIEALTNPFYFPHVTLEVRRGDKVEQRELRIERVRPEVGEDFRGYLQDPVGSLKPIESDYVRAMYYHLVQVGAHNTKADAVTDYAKPYNIKAAVEARAKELSKQRGKPVSWEAAFHEEFEPRGYVLFGTGDNPNPFVTVTVDRDKLAQRLGVMLSSSDLQEQLREIGKRDIVMLPGDFREVLNYGPGETWVIPAKVAEALHGISTRAEKAKAKSIDKMVVQWWKQWKLFTPWNHVRYELNNVTADLEKIFSASPGALRYMPQAFTEVRDFWLGKTPTNDLRDAQREGVINTITAQEMGALTRQPSFRDFENTRERLVAETKAILSAPIVNASRLFGPNGMLGRVTSTEESAFREAVFRYAKYLADVNAIRNGARPEYAGAYWRDIEAMGDSRRGANDAASRKAAAISKATFGDYGDLSVLGQTLRDRMVPFYSWTEVNFKYHANLLRNLRDMVRAGELSQAEAAAAGARAAAVFAAGFTTRAAAGVVLRLALPYLAVALWNGSDDRDELEKELSDEDRRRFHIILGRKEDGTVDVVYGATALNDVLKWFNGPQFVQAMSGWMNNRQTFGQAFEQWRDSIGPDFLNNIAGSVSPLFKVPYTLVAKKSTFPDVTDQRSIPSYDMRRQVLGQITDDFIADRIEKLVNKDYYGQKDLAKWARQLILQARNRDPESWAFYAIKEKAAKFVEMETGRSSASSYDAPDLQVLRNFRRAIYRGDIENALTFYHRLLDLGYTAERFTASIRAQDPLSELPKENGLRRRFVESLDAGDRDMLERAMRYYGKINAGRGREAQLFPRQEWGSRGQELYRARPHDEKLVGMMERVANRSDEDELRAADRALKQSLQRR